MSLRVTDLGSLLRVAILEAIVENSSVASLPTQSVVLLLLLLLLLFPYLNAGKLLVGHNQSNLKFKCSYFVISIL